MDPRPTSHVPTRRQGRPERRRCSLRSRRCLLKGCERIFVPPVPGEGFCGPACLEANRRWADWRAQQDYRRSERGRAKRREQSRDYRRRKKLARPGHESTLKPPDRPGEGHRPDLPPGFFPCGRPGCYEPFRPTSRSPLQCFCSSACRHALRRVVLWEARWRKRGFGIRQRVRHLAVKRRFRVCSIWRV